MTNREVCCIADNYNSVLSGDGSQVRLPANIIPLSLCILLPTQCPALDVRVGLFEDDEVHSQRAVTELRKQHRVFSSNSNTGQLQMKHGYIACVGTTSAVFYIAVQVGILRNETIFIIVRCYCAVNESDQDCSSAIILMC
jgi:hypothetical protein